MALDQVSYRLFLVTAEPDQTAAASPGQRRRFVPGSVKLLTFDSN